MSPSTKPTRYAVQAWVRDNLLLIATISGVLMGVVLGKTALGSGSGPGTVGRGGCWETVSGIGMVPETAAGPAVQPGFSLNRSRNVGICVPQHKSLQLRP